MNLVKLRRDNNLHWGGHCIVKYTSSTLGNIYFDPTYGSGPYQAKGGISEEQVLNNSLGGFNGSLGGKENQYWYSSSSGLDISIK